MVKTEDELHSRRRVQKAYAHTTPLNLFSSRVIEITESKLVLTSESVDKILRYDHSNETCSAGLSHSTIYFVCSSSF